MAASSALVDPALLSRYFGPAKTIEDRFPTEKGSIRWAAICRIYVNDSKNVQ